MGNPARTPPTPSLGGQFRSRPLGRALYAFSILLNLCGFAVFFIAPAGWYYLLCLPFFFAFGFIHLFALRINPKSVDELKAEDPRPPILYLRSFALDDIADESSGSGLDKYLPESVAHARRHDDSPRIKDFIGRFGTSLERTIADEFDRLGPVIAIGNPNEKLVKLGAARMYAGDDWQERILAELKIAALVILRPGISAGLRWEFDRVLELCDPRRVILIFWQTSDADYERFRASVADAIQLPPIQDRQGRELIRFDQNRYSRFESIPRRSGLRALTKGLYDLPALIDSLAAELGYQRDGKHYSPPAPARNAPAAV